jgi:hypothetical protein
MAKRTRRLAAGTAGQDAANNDKVETPTSTYEEQKLGWALPTALMAGTAGMRAAGIEYLPQEQGESKDEYDKRLARSFLFNAFRRTVETVNGKVFSKSIVLQDDVPPQIKTWTENIDLAGRNINVFASEVLKEAMQKGLTHVLVDMQKQIETRDAAGNPRPPSVAEVKAAGRRPYFVHIKPENLIGWQSEVKDGVPTLTQIRVKECAKKKDGKYGEKTVERVRVIEPDKFELYEKDQETGDFTLVDSGTTTLGFIALATFYTKRSGFMTAECPLQDLADLNVMHWQSSSDQRNILHFARVPILFRAGFGDKDGGVQEVGANRMFTAKDANAKMEVVEHSGAAIDAGRQDLLDTEDRMRVMGLELFIGKPGQVTATSRNIDSEEVNSTVKSWAQELQDTLELALDYMGRWGGLGDDKAGQIKVNTDFGITLRGADDIRSLIDMRKSREISRETFWKEMKRRTLLADDFDAVKEAVELETEAESLANIPPASGDNQGGNAGAGDNAAGGAEA